MKPNRALCAVSNARFIAAALPASEAAVVRARTAGEWVSRGMVLFDQNRNVVVDFANHSYAKEIARARTFGFMQDVEAMRSAGLGLGGSLQNAVVLDEFKVLNSEGLRYDNEFVRHKVLDAIGDIYLLGHPLIGQYTAYKSGHALNNKLTRALLARAEAFEIVTFSDEKTVPTAFHDWSLKPA